MNKKKDTCIDATCKRLIWDPETHTERKWRDGINVFHTNGNRKKGSVAILVSLKKINFRLL